MAEGENIMLLSDTLDEKKKQTVDFSTKLLEDFLKTINESMGQEILGLIVGTAVYKTISADEDFGAMVGNTIRDYNPQEWEKIKERLNAFSPFEIRVL